jgi:hypothetical protein
MDDDKCWWLLDLFLARASRDQLVEKSWELGYKWGAGLIGVEDVGFQAILRQDFEKRASQMASSGYRPVIWPIKYPGKLSKPARIAALSPKFSNSTIRLPRHMMDQWEWQQLLFQIQYFTMDLENLPHDDAVDSLAMVPYVPTPRSGSRPQYEPLTVQDQILAGRMTDRDTGLPLSLFIDVTELDDDLIETIKMRKRKLKERENRAKTNSSAQERMRKRAFDGARSRGIMDRRRRRN